MIDKSIKKIALLFMVLVFCALPAVYLKSIFGYIPILFVIFLIVISYVYEKVLIKNLEIVELSDLNSCKRGTDIDFEVLIKNKSFLVCPKGDAVFYVSDIFGNIRSTNIFGFTISPYEERTFKFAINFDHIGQYNAGLSQIRVASLLSLYSLGIDNTKEYHIDVTPKVHNLERLLISDKVYTEGQRALIRSESESSDYSGVREYSIGDPMKLIHWKLSSHSGNYVTKLMESYGRNGITVIPNFLSPKYSVEILMDVFDAIIETCISVCCNAQENGMDAELLYYDKYAEKSRYIFNDCGDFSDLLSSVPLVYTESKDGYGDATFLLHNEARSMYSNSNIAFCTAVLNEDIIQSIMSVYHSRKCPILFYIHPNDSDKKEFKVAKKHLNHLESLGIIYYVISSANDIGKVVN